MQSAADKASDDLVVDSYVQPASHNNDERTESQQHLDEYRRKIQRRSSLRDSLGYIRKVFANRQSDYHSDAAQFHENVTPALQSRTPSQSHVENNNNNNENEIISAPVYIPEPPTQRFFYHRLMDKKERQMIFLNFLNNRYWKLALVVFAIILLFGAQIRNLFIPKSADQAVDILFCIVFLFLSIDLLMRIDAEANYFFLDCYQKGTGWCCCKMGSFLFWCDILSTLSLLSNITWVSKSQNSEKQIDVLLDAFGVPVSLARFA